MKQEKNWEDSSLCPEASTKNAVQEFHFGTAFLLYWNGKAYLSMVTASLENLEIIWKTKGGKISDIANYLNLLMYKKEKEMFAK